MPQDHKADLENLAAQCALRAVKPEHKDLILKMRNQEHVRQNMLNSDVISSESHEKWFSAMMISDEKEFFIFTQNDIPAGVIGFYDLNHGTANWTFYLSSQNPPKGLGTIMCALGLNRMFESRDISKIRTMVLENNIKSLRLHERLGFHKTGQDKNTIMLELDKETYEKTAIL